MAYHDSKSILPMAFNGSSGDVDETLNCLQFEVISLNKKISSFKKLSFMPNISKLLRAKEIILTQRF